jgi:DNA-directed RNA polymerase specialized sigma24 family protein
MNSLPQLRADTPNDLIEAAFKVNIPAKLIMHIRKHYTQPTFDAISSAVFTAITIAANKADLTAGTNLLAYVWKYAYEEALTILAEDGDITGVKRRGMTKRYMAKQGRPEDLPEDMHPEDPRPGPSDIAEQNEQNEKGTGGTLHRWIATVTSLSAMERAALYQVHIIPALAANRNKAAIALGVSATRVDRLLSSAYHKLRDWIKQYGAPVLS